MVDVLPVSVNGLLNYTPTVQTLANRNLLEDIFRKSRDRIGNFNCLIPTLATDRQERAKPGVPPLKLANQKMMPSPKGKLVIGLKDADFQPRQSSVIGLNVASLGFA